MFTPQRPSPHSTNPPSSKMQAIDVPSKPSPPPPAPPATLPPFRGRARTYEDIPLTNIRKVIATRLLQSKQTIPHSYVQQSVDMTEALAFRSSLKQQAVTPLPSLNDLIVRATALSLRRHPAVNAVKGKEEYSISPTVDISVAVATPTGLITPIIPQADRRRLKEITETVKDLAGRAKQGKLKPEEFQGGSFTISNLGMYGVKHFSAIINPPQACILAVGGNTEGTRLGGGGGGEVEGGIAPRYVPSPTESAPSYSTPAGGPTGAAVGVADTASELAGGVGVSVRVGDLSVSPMMGLTLVFDERAIDAEQGAEFLETLKEMLENPSGML